MQDWNLDDRQRNSLKYFVEHAADWRERAEADGLQRVSTILQRNSRAIALVDANPGRFQTAIDLGCGTGELVMELAQRGLDGCGIDYSGKMIELANEKAEHLGLSDRCHFIVDSVMDHNYQNKSFDLITAFGFIEYLRPEELPVFFSTCRRLLNKGGAFLVGSRNRLFNSLSLNKFTTAEVQAGTIETLLQESIDLVSAEHFEDFVSKTLANEAATEVLKDYPQTDVAVAGYQYCPSELICMLDDAGFESAEISPVHFHGMVPAVARENTSLHAQFSNTIHDQFQNDYRLVPQSSTYILFAK